MHAVLNFKNNILLLFSTKIMLAPCILWSGVLEQSFGAEYWSGVESDFRVAKVEWSAVVMCVCY